MKYPSFLKEGGTIGFVAPSFGCAIEPYRQGFDRAQQIFRQKGYRILLGPNVYAGDGTGISTSPEKCGRELTDLYCSEDCDVLISCGGGELMCETMDHVDFRAIEAAPPKWYMGYSDNTNFTFLLPTLCDTASIYGPCAATFGMDPWHASVTEAFDILRGEIPALTGYDAYEVTSLRDEAHPFAPYNCTEERKIRGFLPGDGHLVEATEGELSMSGRLLGGCLDIMAMLCGTRYDRAADFAERYREDGILWFLEACDLNVFGIRRAIWQLRNAGWFRHVKGFLIGRPLAGREDMMNLDHFRAVTELLAEYRVPVLMDVDLGHLPPMMPLITGSIADVTWRPETDDFRLSMKLV